MAHPSISFAGFRDDPEPILARLRETGEAEVLTLGGAGDVVLQDAKSYEALLDRIDELETAVGIRRGLEDMASGRGRSFDVVAEELRERYGIGEG